MLSGGQQQAPPPVPRLTSPELLLCWFPAKGVSCPAFLQFKTKMEQEEEVHFNSDHHSRQELLGGNMLKLTHS